MPDSCMQRHHAPVDRWAFIRIYTHARAGGVLIAAPASFSRADESAAYETECTRELDHYGRLTMGAESSKQKVKDFCASDLWAM